MPRKPRIIVLGLPDFAGDTAGVSQLLHALDDGFDWVLATDTARLELLLQDTRLVDCVLLSTNYPGQLAMADLARWQTLSPPTRFVVVYGDACEGETRTGVVGVGVERVRADAVVGWLRTQAWRAGVGKPTAWVMDGDERVLAGVDDARLTFALRVAVVAVATASAATLGDAARAIGGTLADESTADLVLWDTTGDNLTGADALRERFPQAAIVALVNFPRPQDRAMARVVGVAVLVAKPFTLAGLVAAIEIAVGPLVRR